MTYTPPPWHFYKDEEGNTVAIAARGIGPNGGHVSWAIAKMPVPSKRMSQAEIEANARVMVVAPQLLEALETALTALTLENVCGDQCLSCEKARAAIAKARGR